MSSAWKWLAPLVLIFHGLNLSHMAVLKCVSKIRRRTAAVCPGKREHGSGEELVPPLIKIGSKIKLRTKLQACNLCCSNSH